MQTILLVEDNEMNRDLISRRLKRRGFEVLLAVDGAEGVEKATEKRPDLVLMDMGLPVIDGYEATRLLKTNESTRHIPVVGLSAHAMSGDADRALEAGCDDYDTKPVEWPRLLEKISRQLLKAQEQTTLLTPKVEAEESTGGGAAPAAAARARVLVVDDNAMHRDILTGRLESLGHRCEAVHDGAEALRRLAGERFDAVMLDVTLPPVDGRSFLERLRSRGGAPPVGDAPGADPPGGDPPILMLTPIDAIDEAIACLAQGAEDFIPQPFRAEVVAARLNSALERHRLRGRESRASDELDGERRRSRHVLRALLPEPLIEELQATGKIVPRRRSGVAVLVCEVAGFTELSESREPLDAVSELQELFVACEDAAERHGILKVRTVGAVFVGAAGLFEASPDGAMACVQCGLEILQAAGALGSGWSVRVGVHLGPVVAGVVGHRRYQFDLWGRTVELAHRVKDRGAAGAVNVSDVVWKRCGDQLSGGSLGESARDDESSMALYLVNGLAG